MYPLSGIEIVVIGVSTFAEPTTDNGRAWRRDDWRALTAADQPKAKPRETDSCSYPVCHGGPLLSEKREPMRKRVHAADGASRPQFLRQAHTGRIGNERCNHPRGSAEQNRRSRGFVMRRSFRRITAVDYGEALNGI